MLHLHLDPLGGVAGDMFAASLLDAFPEHEATVAAAVRLATGVVPATAAHNDGTLSGRRFQVPQQAAHDHHHHHDGHHHDHHHHATWRGIRAGLAAAGLAAPVAEAALAIFGLLAEAEARVHGVPADDVTFHEVGALDSIADIVAAAALLHALGPATWSVAPLPLGGGRVRTAHGPMPVPAPATALLLEGFAVLDDGIGGERVTPTGAAILRHLRPAPAAGQPMRVLRSGFGFGTRALPGISNCLRVLAFAQATETEAGTHRHLAVLAFEVDDQAAEDLAAGLDRLRAMPGVHDVVQMAAAGKKGRLATHIQVLARPDAAEHVAEACFRETTTIGLRVHVAEGRALRRELREVAVDGHTVRVKLVHRPGGTTAKADSDDGLMLEGHAARARLRRAAEALAVGQPE